MTIAKPCAKATATILEPPETTTYPDPINKSANAPINSATSSGKNIFFKIIKTLSIALFRNNNQLIAKVSIHLNNYS
ncbi:MAG: hypothetical protein QMB22_03485 [Dehalococcoidia bacterium]|nr:MAG: hypothetical protein DK305_000541 [Chloroflexota bacterium]